METGPVPPEAVATHLERVLGSATFRGAERSSRLLRFIVEEALQGRADRLKDYTLGSEALGRGEQFDPRTDPIARVEASRLRSRLDVYYATDGLSDTVRISLPKGGYAPVFEVRPAATPIGQPIGDPLPVPPTVRTFRSWPMAFKLALAGMAVAVAVPTVIAGWLFTRPVPRPPPAQEVWPEITTPPTTMDARDCGFVAWIPLRRVSSSEPSMRRFPSGPPMVGRSGSSRTARSSGSISRVVSCSRCRLPLCLPARPGTAME